MIELLKCFATGLALIVTALAIVAFTMASITLVNIFPLAGGITYVVFMVLLVAIGTGWAVRNP